MQTTTSVSTAPEGSANPRYPTARSVQIGGDTEPTDLLSFKHVNVQRQDSQRTSTTGTANAAVVQTKAQRLHARVQFATVCWIEYLAGWNDGSTGPLLSRIQKVYNVRVVRRGCREY